MSGLENIKRDLNKLADKRQAALLQRFFKTGRGEYGEGDVFIGIKVPIQRQVAKRYKDLSNTEVVKLLHSKIHEYRLTALLIFTYRYKTETLSGRKKIYELYLRNTRYINNWDLVDVTTPNIMGEYLLDRQRDILYKLARSKSLWERRMAILATFTFISNNDYADALRLAKLLLDDKHDLIHKAVGWMLREVGKRDINIEENFLKKYHQQMPRTMLRYAIEKFPEIKRKKYLDRS
ncbi:DNA alkylation repair protein [Patescibacteria group bacterium]